MLQAGGAETRTCSTTQGCCKLCPCDCPSKHVGQTFLGQNVLFAPPHCLPLCLSPWKQNKMFLINSRALACLPLYGATDQTPQYAAAAKSLQLCPTLCDPIEGSLSGSPFPGILQARTLEWVAISFSNAWKWKVKGKSLSCVRIFTTPWTAAYQAPPSMGFSRQEYWSGLPLPSLTSVLEKLNSRKSYSGFRNRREDL